MSLSLALYVAMRVLKQVVANVERHANVRPADVLIKLKEIYITTVKADRRCK